MKKYLLFSVIASFAALYSCTNEEDSLLSKEGSDKVVATIENDNLSRTVMNGTYVNWVEDDQIGIFFQNEVNSKPYTLEGNGGSTSGEFYYKEGVIEQGAVKVLAYYPYSSNDVTYTDGALNFILKEEHEYSATSSNGFPMIAKIAADSQDKIQFKNAGAILAITVKNLPTEYQYVTLTAADNDSKIAGKAKISYNNLGFPILEIVEDESNSSTIKIKLAENRTATIDECTFYFPLPVANYSNLTFKLHKSDSESITGKEKALDAKRNMRYNATLVFDKVSTEITSEAASAADATAALANGANSVQVSVPSTEEEPTITLPAASSNEETTSVSLYFDKIEATAGVAITEGTEGNAASNVTISAPEGEGTNNVFNINLPNSTVTLDANGESATYNDVTASTADETLIISQNVTVMTLKVKGGHVRVHGTIGNISRDEENQDDVTYIIKEEGAVITGSITDEKIKVVSAAEYDLRKAIEKADANTTITLDNDVVLTSQLTITKNLTLNLNSKTISNTTDIWNDAEGIKTWSLISVQGEGVEVTITGEGTLNALENDCYAVDVRDNATVNLENGTYVGNISAVYAINNATANIKGGTYSIQQLSTYQDYRYLLNLKDNSESSIVVTGGTFKNYDPANSNGENPIANLVASGYSSVADGDNYVVSEGIKNEEALIAAIASAETDATITLADDIVLSSQLTITKSLTLDLNGKTISNTTDIWNDAEGIKTWSLISVQGEGVEVTITGEGTLQAKNGDCYAVDVRDNATVNLENGTYVGNISAVYAINNATANIKGGTYSIQQLSTYQDYRYLLNLKDSSESSIVVTGGTFYNFNPNNNQAEGTETNFVGEGYTVSETTENETNIYTVSKSEN